MNTLTALISADGYDPNQTHRLSLLRLNEHAELVPPATSMEKRVAKRIAIPEPTIAAQPKKSHFSPYTQIYRGIKDICSGGPGRDECLETFFLIARQQDPMVLLSYKNKLVAMTMEQNRIVRKTLVDLYDDGWWKTSVVCTSTTIFATFSQENTLVRPFVRAWNITTLKRSRMARSLTGNTWSELFVSPNEQLILATRIEYERNTVYIKEMFQIGSWKKVPLPPLQDWEQLHYEIMGITDDGSIFYRVEDFIDEEEALLGAEYYITHRRGIFAADGHKVEFQIPLLKNDSRSREEVMCFVPSIDRFVVAQPDAIYTLHRDGKVDRCCDIPPAGWPVDISRQHITSKHLFRTLSNHRTKHESIVEVWSLLTLSPTIRIQNSSECLWFTFDADLRFMAGLTRVHEEGGGIYFRVTVWE